jgi:hypothetical protein
VLYEQFSIDNLKGRADLEQVIEPDENLDCCRRGQPRMNLCRYRIFIIIFLLLPLAAEGQQLPKPVLIDEFGWITCGDLVSRTDSLAAELKEEPDSKAFIIIRPPTVRPERGPQSFRRWISSTLQLRGVESDRFSFYRDHGSANEIRTQFWKLVPGANPPSTDSVLWNEEVTEPDTTRAFIFGYEDELGICPTFVPKSFAKLILDNPGSRGHVVISVGDDPSLGKFYFAEQWIKELVGKQGVPRNRLRLFFKKGKGLMVAEFWFVPARKNWFVPARKK